MTDLDKLIAELDAAVEGALDDVAEKAANIAAKRAGGRLGASVRVARSRQGREVVTDAPYAGFVENGRPGITAAPGKVLRFVIGGRTVFARSVGPAKAQPFMAPARAYLEANAAAAVSKAIARIS